MRAAGLDPLGPYPGAHSPWPSRCTTCGNECHPQYSHVRQRGSGCRTCGYARVATRRKLPSTTAVEQMRSAGFEPLEPYPGAHKAWRSIHLPCGAECSPTLSHAKHDGGGCARCGRARTISARLNNPETCIAVMRAAGLEPQQPYPGRHRPWRSLCVTCGQVVSPHYGTVAKGGGCKHCAISKNTGPRVEGADAVDVMTLAGMQPIEDFPGAGKPWRCVCLICGRVGTPTYNNVRRQGGACAHCRHTKSSITRIHGNADNMNELMLAAGFEPLTEYPGRARPWLCRHTRCGSEVAVVAGRIAAGGGCPACSSSGFKRDQRAIIYLATHPSAGAHKVGIANIGSGRLDKHRRRGWEIVGVLDCETGEKARSIESAVLHRWRVELGLPPGLLEGDGWTETIPSAALTLDRAWNQVRAAHMA
ncbi:MAG: hypothetical protein RL238_3294 [Actinomycetota bacterium]